jgi:hypothetical protein
MTTIPAEIGLVAQPDLEQTRTAARRLVASYATDATDCALLLDVLGLRGEPLCTECGEKMSRPDTSGNSRGPGSDGMCWQCRPKVERHDDVNTCRYGHRSAPEGEACVACEGYVPVADLRMVVERIKRDTDMSTSAIARRIEVNPKTLTSVLAPSMRNRRVKRGMYIAVLRLAEELSA